MIEKLGKNQGQTIKKPRIYIECCIYNSFTLYIFISHSQGEFTKINHMLLAIKQCQHISKCWIHTEYVSDLIEIKVEINKANTNLGRPQCPDVWKLIEKSLVEIEGHDIPWTECIFNSIMCKWEEAGGLEGREQGSQSKGARVRR